MQIQLDPQIEAQLKALAAQTGKSEDFYVAQALRNYLEDVEDVASAKRVLSQNNRVWAQDGVERELGFDFSKKSS